MTYNYIIPNVQFFISPVQKWNHMEAWLISLPSKKVVGHWFVGLRRYSIGVNIWQKCMQRWSWSCAKRFLYTAFLVKNFSIYIFWCSCLYSFRLNHVTCLKNRHLMTLLRGCWSNYNRCLFHLFWTYHWCDIGFVVRR